MENNKQFNQLKKAIVILGNGFDLAHNFPTSYHQFSEWLINEIVNKTFEILNNSEENNKFLRQDFYDSFSLNKYNNIQISDPNDYRIPIISALSKNNKIILIQYLKDNKGIISYLLESHLLRNLYKFNKVNWFDVEKTYFDMLYSYIDTSDKDSKIKRINSDLTYIKNKLIEYLKTINYKTSDNIGNFLLSHLNHYDNITFINFNYTETLNIYFNTQLKSIKSKCTVINIHGTLTKQNEIFGYGNDQDEKYQKLKSLENDNLLEHLKTVEYVLDSNYSTFIDSMKSFENYNVYVLGHSLGLTDKTLLQEIFDRKECIKICLFKRLDQKEFPTEVKLSYKKNIMSLLRVMNREDELREKVIDFTKSYFFPEE